MYFGIDPFILVSMPFFVIVTAIFYGQIHVFRTGGIAINIVTDFFRGVLIPGGIRNQCFREIISIAEISIDILLLGIRAAGGL